MQRRLLDFLRCPNCKQRLDLIELAQVDDDIYFGVLHCADAHLFPVVEGIPRMLPNSFSEHLQLIKANVSRPVAEPLKCFIESTTAPEDNESYDIATKANFSNEWNNHDVGGRTWTMELSDRIEWYFIDPLKIPKSELDGKIMLDAGCGNGSQSVGYTELGLEVVALDLSTGLEKGYEYRKHHKNAKPEKVHFVQADLQNPPLAEKTFDIIHSAGVLHHTPKTEATFRTISHLLKEGGTFYVWVYKYEKNVTPIVNGIRSITTRLPAAAFATIAKLSSLPFIAFCWTANKLGLRKYETPNRREATLAVHDIFGAPYAHYHSYEELSEWYASIGISETWPCNDDRRGFGICGKKI
ncbi:MAG: methyltransferase domain-containing protein [Acidobacteriota bacterium]